MNLKLKTAIHFFSLILLSILTVYYAPGIFSSIWFIVLLYLYWKSKNEPLWFALFFVLSDGFMGFFGAYQATIPLIPGLPPVEVAQFYIIMTVLKVWNNPRSYPVFFNRYLSLMGIYVIFLIVLGFLFGINRSPNDYFRIVKLTLPLLLFYSLPKLIANSEDYMKIFCLLFPVAILAFATQLFDILAGQTLIGFLGARSIRTFDVIEGQIYRGFYNPNIVLISLFGAMYFSSRKERKFNLIYLYLIILTTFSMAFLSASRGWILAFGLIAILYSLIMIRIKTNRLVFFIFTGVIIFSLGMRNPFINKQVTSSYDRFSTMEAVAEGDLTAGGTATRATDQSKRVMDKWKESPVTGWGFSEEFRQYMNEHVGNQTMLLHSGLIGALLMLFLFYVFNIKLIKIAFKTKGRETLIFSIFFLGWFIIHSTSGQHFAYYQMPKNIMAQSLFLSFGALVYWNKKIYSDG